MLVHADINDEHQQLVGMMRQKGTAPPGGRRPFCNAHVAIAVNARYPFQGGMNSRDTCPKKRVNVPFCLSTLTPAQLCTVVTRRRALQ